MEDNEWLRKKIKEEGGMEPESIRALVEKKLDEFPSLTENAALRMIATEHGIVPMKKKLKIEDVTDDVKHLNIVATIRRKFEPREITIKGTPSTISSMILEDETGSINTVVWDTKKVEQIEREASNGDTISIANAYARKTRDGEHYEIHLGTNCAIKIIPSTRTQRVEKPVEENLERISDVTDTPRKYTVRGMIARIFTGGNLFIVRCGICKKKVEGTCEEHGDKALSKTMMVSGILDDGLSSIKISFFDKVADKLLSLSDKEELDDKLNDLSFGMYEVVVTGVPNSFNGKVSLNARDIRQAGYLLQ